MPSLSLVLLIRSHYYSIHPDASHIYVGSGKTSGGRQLRAQSSRFGTDSASKANPSPFESLRAAIDVTGQSEQEGDELDRFIHDRPVSISGTALEWWSKQADDYPRLQYLARDIFSIPPMSDEPERVFSSSRRVLSWDRARLSDEVLQRLQCIKHWKKNGHISRILEADEVYIQLEDGMESLQAL